MKYESNTYDFFCLRMAAFPLDSIYELNNKLENCDVDNHDEIVNLIKEFFVNDYFLETIFMASNDLFTLFEKLKHNNFYDKEETKKLFHKLYKYYIRICSRATPLGLFSGITAGDISNEKSNVLFFEENHRLNVILNMHTFLQIISKIDPLDYAYISKVKYFKNNTLYKVGNQIYYIEEFFNGRFNASNLTSIELNEYLEKIINLVEKGATVIEMAEAINIENISFDQKTNFIKSIIEAKIIVPEYWPSAMSADYINDFIKYMEQKEISTTEFNELKKAYQVSKKITDYKDIKKIRAFDGEMSKHNALLNHDLFKVDLYLKTAYCNINDEVIKQIEQTSYELMLLQEHFENEYLKEFISAFKAKYEEAEIPLLEVIDPQSGIGFELLKNGSSEDTPLLTNIPILSPDNAFRKSSSSYLDQLLIKVFKEFTETKSNTITIDSHIEKYISENSKFINFNVTNSAYIYGTILTTNNQDIDTGEFKFHPIQFHAPYAGRLLSRFANGDKKIGEMMKIIAEDEKKINENLILAELTTIPNDYYANITLTNEMRDFEIPILCGSTAKNVIHLSDLTVSIKNDRVVLKSKKLEKEIFPCVTNVFNSHRSTAVYKFLSALNLQNIRTGHFWDWSMFYAETFLPRIEYKNFIISRARWVINKRNIDYKNHNQVAVEITKIKNELNLPRYIVLPHEDNELLLDLNNVVSMAILAKEVNNNITLVYENIETIDNTWIKKNQKKHASQIVIPVKANAPIFKFSYNQTIKEDNKIQRKFSPGSDWLYLKVYTGSKNIEKILTDVLFDFTNDLINENAINKWFFIKYFDTNYHLRIRFFNQQESKNLHWYRILEKLQNKISECLSLEHSFEIIVDTYKREIERYGIDTMECSESIFQMDSQFVCEILNIFKSYEEEEELRWRFAFSNVDTFLNDFGFNLSEKKEIMQNLSDTFFQEFSFNEEENEKTLRRALNDKFRECRVHIKEVIHRSNFDSFTDIYECINKRSNHNKDLLKNNDLLLKNEKMKLINSYIHMNLNRYFLVNQRRHELCLYYLLNKYYESEIAQLKYQKHEKIRN